MTLTLSPPTCALCHCHLTEGEEGLCLVCQSALPRVRASGPDSAVAARIFMRIDCQHATSFVDYTARTGALIKQAKYGRHPRLNRLLARLFATELTAEGWPYDIDLIVPVPIHPLRRLWRGYNQVEHMAAGLADVWGLPVELHCLLKRRYTRSQVQRDFQLRLRNVEGSFGVSHPERLAGRHVLIVDDVMTSGATLDACAQALRIACPGVRLSVATLALARR